ncbi:AAA family ATPase [Acidihalobacter ferrooxydans]|uniref:AAA+ ATPase domain-containing protein n=1 Tax=Acidihalobacter ferrooxydans TaxID=1765967 RepID=A0A1P8UFI0_9GAMM|nr:AAA family ATPase [Acidihalobacter ferrooxydans]APZ42514.1 hypothetical protein BW247_04925 [Acidihalobacter ferrooxydans]
MSITLYDAFVVTSPVADTKKIPLDKVCSLGNCEQVEPDPNYVFEYRTVKRVLKNIGTRKPMWIHGPSGCGKTELMVQVGARLKRPVHVISMGEETSLRELLGTFELKSAESKNGFETAFQYGALTQAMQNPGAIVVLDEFNMAPSTVAAQFNRLLETGEITVPETGETVKAADNVTFVVTANTSGGIDESGIYAGSQAQNGATRSRFSGLRVNYLPRDLEEQIIVRSFPRINAVVQLPETNKSLSALMVETAIAIRSLVADQEVSLPFTVRNLKEWAGSTLAFRDIGEAFTDAYFDMLGETERTAVGEVFQRMFGWNLE